MNNKKNQDDNRGKDFSEYPSIERLFEGIESNNIDELFNRLKESHVNLDTCNSLIEETKERKIVAPYKDFAAMVPTVALAVFYVLSINQKSKLGSSLMEIVYLIIIGGLAFWLQYKVLPARDSRNYLKALRIYQRYLMMYEENSSK